MGAVIAHLAGVDGELVPRAGRKAIVAAIDAIAKQRPQFLIDRAAMLDRQVGNAAPRIQLERRRKGPGGAGVQTGGAAAAVVALGRVGRQVQRGEDRAKEEPVPQFARQDVGVLALPAQPRRLRQRLFHHRRGIDKDLDLGSRLIDQPAADALQPRLDQVVIVAALRIDADRAPVRAVKVHTGIVAGGIDLGQHHDRPRFSPQRGRVAAPVRPLGHPAHLPVPSLRDEIGQPRRRLRDRVRRGHAHGRKSFGQRAGHQRVLLCRNIPGGIAPWAMGGGAPLRPVRNRAGHNAARAGCPAPDRPARCGTRAATSRSHTSRAAWPSGPSPRPRCSRGTTDARRR